MHTAPSVDYPLGRSRFHTFALLIVLLGVLIVDGYWLTQSNVSNGRVGLAFCLSLLSAGASLHAWRYRPVGILRWDGKSWWWLREPVHCAGSINVHLDVQGSLLLRFCADGGVCQWFWVDRGFAPSLWMALRRAVHAGRRGEGRSTHDAVALASAEVSPARLS